MTRMMIITTSTAMIKTQVVGGLVTAAPGVGVGVDVLAAVSVGDSDCDPLGVNTISTQ